MFLTCKKIYHRDVNELFNIPVEYRDIKELGELKDKFTNIIFEADNLNYPRKSNGDIIMIKRLIFGRMFNQPLNEFSIPKSVSNLTLGDRFNQPLTVGLIPNSISNLKDCILLPQNTHLTFGNDFNKPLNINSIPYSVTYLTFGYSFNKPLNEYSIPESVTHLTFGENFNQSLNEGSIPESVTNLTFGLSFNKALDKITLPNLKYLVISKNYRNNKNLLPHGSYNVKYIR